MICTCGRKMFDIERSDARDVWICWKPWGCGRKIATLPLEDFE